MGRIAWRSIASLAIASTVGCDGQPGGPDLPPPGSVQPLPPEYACYVAPPPAMPARVGFETVVLAPDTKPTLLLSGVAVSILDTTRPDTPLGTVRTDDYGRAALQFSTEGVEQRPYALAARYTAGHGHLPTYRYFGFPVDARVRFGVGLYDLVAIDDAYSLGQVSRQLGKGTLIIRVDSCTSAQAVGAVLHITPAPQMTADNNELLKIDPQTRATTGAVAYNIDPGPVEITIDVGGTPILDLHLTIQPDAITILSTLN